MHVTDDKRRVALIETTTVDSSAPSSGLPVGAYRYQLANHLGSTGLELNEVAALISYEEYHPYGTTSLWLHAGAAEVSERRYRYTGKEKDDETSLYLSRGQILRVLARALDQRRPGWPHRRREPGPLRVGRSRREGRSVRRRGPHSHHPVRADQQLRWQAVHLQLPETDLPAHSGQLVLPGPVSTSTAAPQATGSARAAAGPAAAQGPAARR